MPIKINASIVDLTRDAPKPTDTFLVDSNVWYWIGYSNASLNPQRTPPQSYPNYINNALLSGSQLVKCALSFSELAHIIERDEREIYNSRNKTQHTAKYFRHNFPLERAQIVSEIESAWILADSITAGRTLEVSLNIQAIAAARNRMALEALDGYDLFMVDALQTSGIRQIITDDGDFGQVAGITVFTANQTLLIQAQRQRKLIAR